MSLDDYVPGEISLIFKPSATVPEMNALLFSYAYEKVFPEEKVEDPAADQTLARMYLLRVEVGREEAVLDNIKRQYDPILEEVSRSPLRTSCR